MTRRMHRLQVRIRLAGVLAALLLVLAVTGRDAWAEKPRPPLPTSAVQAAVSRVFEVLSVLKQRFLFRLEVPQVLTAALDAVCTETGDHRITDWEARHLDWNTFRTHFVTLAMRRPERADALSRVAIRAMMDELDDPYTSYVPRDEYRILQARETGQVFAGLGVEVAPCHSGLRIVASLEGSPARTRGLRPGDEILAVDGHNLLGMGFDHAADLLLGQAGTTVRLLVRGTDGRARPIDVRRAQVTMPPVRTQVLSTRPLVAYIRLSVFGPSSSHQTRAALERFTHEGMAGLILDLRDNPGGRMASALGIGALLAPGRVLVKVQRRGMPEEVQIAPGMPRATHPAMVVLVNRGTASSAELVAGALQDAGLATVMGNRTFGKGHIQTVIPLSDGGALRITSARYTTPSGRDVNGRGITPDVIVQEDDSALERALHVILRKVRGCRGTGA